MKTWENVRIACPEAGFTPPVTNKAASRRKLNHKLLAIALALLIVVALAIIFSSWFTLLVLGAIFLLFAVIFFLSRLLQRLILKTIDIGFPQPKEDDSKKYE